MTPYITTSLINRIVRRARELREEGFVDQVQMKRTNWLDRQRAIRLVIAFSVVVIAVPLCSITVHGAPLAYDENVDGDLLGGFQPIGPLDVGINTVSGSITGSVDGGDRWDVDLPLGLEIFQIDYTISNFSPNNPGDRGIFAFAPSNFIPQQISANGSFSWPAGDLPYIGPLTLNDHFFMRDHQISGMEVSFHYVVSIHVRAAGGDIQTITEDTIGDFTLEPGESLKVTAGATLTGNVTVDGGILIVEDGAIIDGSILGTEGGDIIIDGGATVTGNIEHTGGTLLIAGGSTVEGDAIRVNTFQSIIENGSTILGTFSLINPRSVSVADSHIGDGILIDITGAGIFSSNGISLDGATVTGNILIDITGAGIALDELSFSASNSDIAGNLEFVMPGDNANIDSASLTTTNITVNNVLIDITGAGLAMDEFSFSASQSDIAGNLEFVMPGDNTNIGSASLTTSNSTVNNILIDITGAGIVSTVSLTDTTVSHNIDIDMTGAAIQAGDLDVVLTGTTAGNNILIDITGAGIQAVSDVSLSAVETKNNILIDITGAGVIGGSTVKVEGSQVGKHLMVKGSETVEITDNTIGKHLKVRDTSGTCIATNNVVGGKIKGCQ